MSPRNAALNTEGLRVYSWEPEGQEPVHVLSVTSIRKLCGVTFQIQEWQLKNVINLATGTRQQVRIGPRGGVSKVYVADGEFPGNFMQKMLASGGIEDKLQDLRRWLRQTADEPRDIAAVRGSVVHKLIEDRIPTRKLTDRFLHRRFEQQWADERGKIKREITDQDYLFARNAMRQYWNMRDDVPFVILASEPQLWNLTAGYAGSADVLMWFLPEGTSDVLRMAWQDRADAGSVTIEDIREFGGSITLGDWKTADGVYTDNVVQITAYLAAEFIGRDGVIDERLTAILHAMLEGAIIHIRPDYWSIDYVEFQAPVLRAFLGSVAFARFLASYPEPHALFSRSLKGEAPAEEGVE